MPLSPESLTRRITHQVLARLACLIHAANVHSEPGSNPSNDCLNRTLKKPPQRENPLKSLSKHLKFSMKKSIPVHPRKWAHIFVIKHRRVSSRLDPAHYPHLTTTKPTENCRNRSHSIRMPRAVHVYKKTRSLTHDLKPPRHPQMQMKQQLKTAYRVSNQVAKEQRRPCPKTRPSKGEGLCECPVGLSTARPQIFDEPAIQGSMGRTKGAEAIINE